MGLFQSKSPYTIKQLEQALIELEPHLIYNKEINYLGENNYQCYIDIKSIPELNKYSPPVAVPIDHNKDQNPFHVEPIIKANEIPNIEKLEFFDEKIPLRSGLPGLMITIKINDQDLAKKYLLFFDSYADSDSTISLNTRIITVEREFKECGIQLLCNENTLLWKAFTSTFEMINNLGKPKRINQ